MIVKYVIVTLICVKTLQCCSNFKNTPLKTILNDKSEYNLTLSGCIERIAFYQDNVQRVIIEIHIEEGVQHLWKDSVRHMSQLRTFAIKNTELSRIHPGCFRNVPRITTIEFTGNRLTEIAYGIFNNSNVSNLSLNNNQIYLIENNAFEHMDNLRYLNLSNNNFDAMSRNWFYDLPALELVDFSYNKIRTIPQKIFIHARNVTHVYFDHNDITDIQRIAFEGVTKLKYLGLKNNLLKRINQNVFPSKFDGVDTLYINSNRFNDIDASFLMRARVKVINLDGNPWKCSCFMDILEIVRRGGGNVIGNDECRNFNVPVCAVLNRLEENCKDGNFTEVTNKFYGVIKYENLTQCVRYLEIL